MATLSDLYNQHRGKVSDKWSLYLRVYEDLFRSRQSAALNLLEIGIQNGGSLELWAQYFPNAKHVVGCDMDPACGTLFFDDPRISVVIGDVNAEGTIQSLQSICQGYDVIIDDGSHAPRDVIAAFLHNVPMLTPEACMWPRIFTATTSTATRAGFCSLVPHSTSSTVLCT